MQDAENMINMTTVINDREIPVFFMVKGNKISRLCYYPEIAKIGPNWEWILSIIIISAGLFPVTFFQQLFYFL